MFYERSRVDNYADYSQYDGLVQRIAQFKDFKRHIVDEMR